MKKINKIIGALLMTYALFCVTSCSEKEEVIPNDYISYKAYSSDSIKLNCMFTEHKYNELTGYYVYIYTAKDMSCESYKNIVFSYLENNVEGVNLYLSEAEDYMALWESGKKESIIGRESLDGFILKTIPTLVYVSYGRVREAFQSYEAIDEELSNPIIKEYINK